MRDDQTRRAGVHAALSEPARLAIVDDLAPSDRSPSELARALDLPGNLLAHHLDVLERAGLIERFASSGDRRRRYVRLVRAPLTELGITARPPAGPVLFVCSHNMARSQLAAALWRRQVGGPAASAGTRPADRIHPQAIATARRHGIDLPNVRPRRIGEHEGTTAVITVCDRAHEELEPRADWRHWSIADPVEVGTPAAFEAAFAELADRIRALQEVA